MTRARPAGLGFIFVAVLIDVLGVGLIAPVLPELIRSFEDGNTALASNFYGLLVALYALMSFLFASFVGSLSDRFGRRPVLLLSLLGLGLDYVIIALAPNLAWLVVGRLLAGIFGAIEATANAYIADISAPEDRAKNFGVLGAAFGIGFVVGPLLGGVLGNIDVRLPFWAAAALSLLNVLYGLFVLPESLPKERRRPFRFARANPFGALLALRRFSGVLRLTGVYALTRLALSGLIAVWVLYTAERFDWNALQVGLSLAVTGFALGTVQGALVAPIVARLGEGRTALLGLALSCAAYLLFAFATSPVLFYVAILLSAFGGLVVPALQALLTSRVAEDEQGLLQGALASLDNLANVIAPPVAAGVFAFAITRSASGVPLGTPLFLSAALELAALIAVWSAVRRDGTRVASPRPS